MKFTKSTYRRARYLAIKRILEVEALIDWIEARENYERYRELVNRYDREVSLGFKIVDRARRERGMYDF